MKFTDFRVFPTGEGLSQNLLIPHPNWRNSQPVSFPLNFCPPPCQSLITPLNKNFHVTTPQKFIFSCNHCSCTICFNFILSLHTGHANFNLNQCSIFTEYCFWALKKVQMVKITPPQIPPPYPPH